MELTHWRYFKSFEDSKYVGKWRACLVFRILKNLIGKCYRGIMFCKNGFGFCLLNSPSDFKVKCMYVSVVWKINFKTYAGHNLYLFRTQSFSVDGEACEDLLDEFTLHPDNWTPERLQCIPANVVEVHRGLQTGEENILWINENRAPSYKCIHEGTNVKWNQC